MNMRFRLPLALGLSRYGYVSVISDTDIAIYHFTILLTVRLKFE